MSLPLTISRADWGRAAHHVGDLVGDPGVLHDEECDHLLVLHRGGGVAVGRPQTLSARVVGDRLGGELELRGALDDGLGAFGVTFDDAVSFPDPQAANATATVAASMTVMLRNMGNCSLWSSG